MGSPLRFSKAAVARAAAAFVQALGEDPEREGLRGLSGRLARAWPVLYGGYDLDPAKILSPLFSAEGYDSMVLLRDVEYYSCCEHHLLPFFGRAHIAYIPRNKIVGISKLARLVDCFARRLQIQERLGCQVVDALMEHLQPLGAGVILEARHLCMTARGVAKQHSVMTTSALRGYFRDDARTREEFLMLATRGEGPSSSAS